LRGKRTLSLKLLGLIWGCGTGGIVARDASGYLHFVIRATAMISDGEYLLWDLRHERKIRRKPRYKISIYIFHERALPV